jgi:hypothetical protein
MLDSPGKLKNTAVKINVPNSIQITSIKKIMQISSQNNFLTSMHIFILYHIAMFDWLIRLVPCKRHHALDSNKAAIQLKSGEGVAMLLECEKRCKGIVEAAKKRRKESKSKVKAAVEKQLVGIRKVSNKVSIIYFSCFRNTRRNSSGRIPITMNISPKSRLRFQRKWTRKSARWTSALLKRKKR